jgi:Pyruvate/2-oxoacid:ferredoxin oxidoreductase gamma subunit
MERELLVSGIGGQGVQLATTVVARAAIAEGRQVQLFGSYGGMMRGGNTETNLVIADGPIAAPPTVGDAWSAILMHHDYSGPTREKLRAGSIVFVNSSVYEDSGDAALDRDAWTVVDVPAMDLAVDLGNVLVGSMVITGAFARYTGLVGIDALTAAVAEALPPYRVKHIDLNQTALRAGWDHQGAAAIDAWAQEVVA